MYAMIRSRSSSGMVFIFSHLADQARCQAKRVISCARSDSGLARLKMRRVSSELSS